MVRSMIHRRGRTTKPLTQSERLTISVSSCVRILVSAAWKTGPRIGAIGKEPFQKRKQAEKRGQQQDAAVAILNIGRTNNRVQQQTLCIYQDMPLLALDELARVESGRIDARSAFFGAFHTLAVDDGGGGTGFASCLLATLLVKRVVDAIQRAVVPPQTEVPIHGATRRQVLGCSAIGIPCSART